MKKKKIVIAVLSVILVCAVCAVAYLAISGGDNKQAATTATTTQTTVSQTETTASVAGSVFNTTKKKTQSTTKDKYPFIRNGVWYLADKDKEVCYAFALKKNGKADVAFFNSDNIEGFDAQYFTGDAKYQIKGKKIVFSKLPKGMELNSIQFDIADKSVKYKGKKLKNYKKISLDYALKCFE